MAHRAATDEICVERGMGKSPSSRRRELVRVPACCLLAPKDIACQLVLYTVLLFCQLREKIYKLDLRFSGAGLEKCGQTVYNDSDNIVVLKLSLRVWSSVLLSS